ncbi:hypothetical protein, partial [Pseudomonas helleri]|uniref:hypothetical protein n=1 Tax=Pseudomonas helleri TaxID=1608996 RepID=UPI001E4F6725
SQLPRSKVELTYYDCCAAERSLAVLGNDYREWGDLVVADEARGCDADRRTAAICSQLPRSKVELTYYDCCAAERSLAVL